MVAVRSAEAPPAVNDRAVAGRRQIPVPRSSAFEQFTFFTVFQPVVDLSDGEIVGYEALTRFADGSSPLRGLQAAQERNQHIDLDAAMLRAATVSARALPDGAWLALNVSAALLGRPRELELLLAGVPRRVVVEIADVPDDGLPALPEGVSIAIDDPGTGYESLARIERLAPGFLKLGRSAVTGVEAEAARKAFVRSLVDFARDRNCTVIAGGIETATQRDALLECGVTLGQGFYLGRPVPVDRALARTAPRGGTALVDGPGD
jgi:EAL domain-containing protein (putative c-di-GMP-specific phosphodiesterase class I)